MTRTTCCSAPWARPQANRASQTALWTFRRPRAEPPRLRVVRSPTVTAFEQTAGDHGLENLIFAIDPSAFYEQTTEGVTGTLAGGVDAYLVPDSFLGYLATGLDYGLLTPTGLDYVLTPLIDLLTGTPLLIPAISTSIRGGCLDRWGWGA